VGAIPHPSPISPQQRTGQLHFSRSEGFQPSTACHSGEERWKWKGVTILTFLPVLPISRRALLYLKVRKLRPLILLITPTISNRACN